MSNLKNNASCSSCGSSLVFNPESGNLKCSHCGTLVAIDNNSNVNFINVENFKKLNAGKVTIQELTEMKSVCPKCGATQRFSNSVINTKCEYCGATISNSLITRFKDENCGVVPFEVSKKQAKSILRNWIKKSKFTPNNLAYQVKEEKLCGNYFPSYIFNMDANTTYVGVGIKVHTQTKTRTDANGNHYTETEEYKTYHPFSGSKNFNYINAYQQAVQNVQDEEFKKLDFNKLNPTIGFKPEYVYGFHLANADIEFVNCLKRAEEKIKLDMKNKIQHSLHFDDFKEFKMRVDFTKQEAKEVYLPIWDGKIAYKQKSYPYYVNGKTGKIYGKLPRSVAKIFGLVGGILLGLAVVGLGIFLLLN